MTYSIKRVGIKSVAMAAFVSMIIGMIPLLPFILLAIPPTYFGIGEPSHVWLEHLFTTIGHLLIYALVVALGASIVALVYNLSVRLHGGINIDFELQEAQPAEKNKN
ncbi:MAG: hypothetical protein OXG53_00765 [Chloroflexi bacterium]|nr:hypothetical protein [Chloroflexota bacterium]